MPLDSNKTISSKMSDSRATTSSFSDFDDAIEESIDTLEQAAADIHNVVPDEDDEEAYLDFVLSQTKAEEEIDKRLALFNQNIPFRSPLSSNPFPAGAIAAPPLPRYAFTMGRRRLSQCKEEENEEEEGSSSANNQSALSSIRKSNSLNNDDKSGLITESSRSSFKEPIVTLPSDDKVNVSRFTVTKTSDTADPAEENVHNISLKPDSDVILRPEAQNLRPSSASHNSQTIHFPCSTPVARRSIQSLFVAPHLDKQFFDTSLVDVREPASFVEEDSSSSFHNDSSTNAVDGHTSDELDIWVKRKERVNDIIGFKLKLSHFQARICPN